MQGDFDQNSHKNLELLRYYLNRDLARIDKNLQGHNNELLGYFLASLVDISVVVLFGELLEKKSVSYKLIAIVILILGFLAVSKIVCKIADGIHSFRRQLGKEEFVVDDAKQAIIDSFDNIACDGLLICESYISKYQIAEKKHVKQFYLYEIIHHLTKSIDVFNEIYSHQELYVSSTETELIDSYRVNNYIDYVKAISLFLSETIPQPAADKELQKDLDNLNAAIDSFKNINMHEEI